MVCKGICIRHKAVKPSGAGRYASGQKRCQICELFINWGGPWCPCCGYRLRAKPRNLKYKTMLNQRTRRLENAPAGEDGLKTNSSAVSPMLMQGH